ncbi:MAG TPA: hypothetical protein VFN67_31135 [Polyangiales bacterium]|nr:hypothetical protein [Polyangiales bacterium]
MAPPKTAITREPIAIDECGATNAAGLSATDVQALKAGSGSPGGLRSLYPYEGTVFPRGMLAPDLMWDGAVADAVYVHIKSKIFEYWGCLKPVQPGRVTLPQEVWDHAGQRSFGRDDDYTIELSTFGAGIVTGPVINHVQIAQAAIKGSIYYNTYRSNLVSGGVPGGGIPGGFPGGFPGGGIGGPGGSNGVVLRIPAGGKAEVFGQTDCNGCHSVSATGSLLLAQSVASGTYLYDLMDNGPAPMPRSVMQNGCWAALYPDGSAALSMSTSIDVARAGIFGAMTGTGNTNATLFDTKTGQTLQSTGIPPGALMPFFSPDGSLLVFNDYAVAEAHGIALTRYDTSTHTASEYTVLYEEPAGATRPGWPFVLPDNGGVVFARTSELDFSGGGVGVSGDVQPGQTAPFSELSVIDIASKKVTLLAQAMGFRSADDVARNATYLPFGEEDLHHHYYPTVSPVGAGGYFWVFFDSVRHYGALGIQRQLWGAAIDISADGTYTKDPSHPAFYLSGQEFGTGNHRAFAALDPCRKDGDKCTSGVDCCGGYCYLDGQVELAEPVGTCSPKMHENMCSRPDERCSIASDCCGSDPPLNCIAGFCAVVRGPD